MQEILQNIIRTDSTNEDFISLTEHLDIDLRERNGELQNFFDQHNKLDTIKDVVVLYVREEPAGCGAFKHYDERTAEIKRIYVRKKYRRHGYSKKMIAELENMIKMKGYSYILLETGAKQFEAISLYKSCGYGEIENYAPYVGNKNSVCMRKKM